MEVKIVGVPRSMIVAGLEGLALLLIFRQGVLSSLSLALAGGQPLLHISGQIAIVKSLVLLIQA